MPVPTQISDGERIASIDHLTNALEVLDYPHHEIHNGTNYRAKLTQEVGSGNSISLTITTPTDGKQCHMLFDISTGNSANVVIYEDTAVTANTGNAVTPLNANRNYPDSSGSTVVSNATVNTTNRVELVDTFIGQPGSNPSDPDTGGESASRHEWILKEGKSYTVVVTETASETQLMHIGFDWYEHTPKLS